MGGETSVRLMQDQVRELLPESTRMKVQKLLAEHGKSITTEQMAKQLGVAGTTIRRHIRAIARDGTLQMCQIPDTVSKREADLQAPNFILDTQIDVLNQLKEANDSMWELVEQIEKVAGDRGKPTIGEINAYIRALAEIRQQLQLQANLVELMLRLDTIKEFQVEVLRVIEEVDPKVAQQIRSRLIEKRAMKSALTGGM